MPGEVIPGDVINAFFERRGVFFIAAGASMPNGLPSAGELARQVALGAHAGESSPFREFCTTTFGAEAPSLDDVAEFFYQRDGNLSAFARLIPFQQWSVPPTEAHRGIARLALEGFLDKVITTNWDLLLETACQNLACRRVPIRTTQELALRRDADLTIYKIHGCQTDFASLVAARSQIESDDPDFLWSEPTVESAFQGSCVIFLGYSGAIARISRSMTKVASWSNQAGVRHFVVDVVSWTDFEVAANSFVSAASLDDSRYSSQGANAFVRELVHRLIRRKVLEVHSEEAQSQLTELLALNSQGSLQASETVDAYVDAVAGGDTAEELLHIMTRVFDTYPSVEKNRTTLARLFAWVGLLRARGWEVVDTLPLLRKGDNWIYLAAVEPGGAATKAAVHVEQQLKMRRDFRQTILGVTGDRSVTCILMGAQGEVAPAMSGIAVNAPTNDLTSGQRLAITFKTEGQALSETFAA